MANTIGTRRIAEHLCVLANILDAEVMRAHALGMREGKELAYRASEVRNISNQLWDEDVDLILHTHDKLSNQTAENLQLASVSLKLV